MRLFNWIFDNKKEAVVPVQNVIDMHKVTNQGKEVYVVKPHRPVTKGGFSWEVNARNYDKFALRRKQEQRLALMGRNW